MAFLRAALFVMEPTDHQLRLSAQAGVTDIVAPYPGPKFDEMLKLKQRVESFGLKLSVIERFWPHSAIVKATADRDQQISDTKALIRNMGTAGVGVLCYNWMQSSDWTRTSLATKDRGGSLVTAFDSSDKFVQLHGQEQSEKVCTANELWDNLKYFLKEVLPVCEECGVTLAMHPDDPPMESLNGVPQIMWNSDALLKLCTDIGFDSPANGVCFCQGTFASGGEDIPAAIRKLSKHIKFIHFRDVVGSVPSFRETWQNAGDTNMAEAIRTYYECGIRDVAIRPDHVPTMDGEDNSIAGYHFLGRLWAIGYIAGLQEGVLVKESK